MGMRAPGPVWARVCNRVHARAFTVKARRLTGVPPSPRVWRPLRRSPRQRKTTRPSRPKRCRTFQASTANCSRWRWLSRSHTESKCTAPTSAGLVPCCGHVTRVGADGRTQGRSWAPYWETVPRMGPRCLGAAVGDAPSPCSCPAVWESGCCAMVCPGP